MTIRIRKATNFSFSKSSDYAKPSAVKQMISLLTIPLENYKNVLTVLKLTNYKKLIDYLNYDSRKKVAISIQLYYYHKEKGKGPLTWSRHNQEHDRTRDCGRGTRRC